MDPRFQTSFIPKKPIVSQAGGVRTKTPINLFSLIGVVLFLATLGVGGAAFFYQSVLDKQIAENKATLDRAKGAFEPELINQIVRLDTRIQNTKKLLSTHISVTPLFDYISSITLKTVRFRNFSFAYLASDKIVVTMQGQGQSYASVALQSDLLNQQKYLKDTVIGDMSLEPTGFVSFSVSTIIDPIITSYSHALNPSGASTSGTGTTTKTQ
jgi:hypothetical protein